MTLTDRLFDCSDPGTGKTRVQIEAISKRGAKSLILAPKTLLESAWGYDIRKYAPHLFYTCAYARNREQAFDTDMQVYITNTDAVNWLAKKPRAWFRKTFGDDAMLIIDESTAFKHRTSLRSKAIARIAPYFKYRSGLTGTPNPNSVTELWHQVKLLDDGVRLGHSFFGFRAQCCTPEQVGPSANHIKWYDKAGIEEVVGYMLKDIVVRHRFDDVMNIPENYMRKIEFKLGNRTREIYQELEDFAYVQLMEQDNITAVNAAVLRNKLLQIASGAVYTEAGYKVLDPQRYDLVMDLVEERDHSIVFFNWAHQRDQLIKVAEKRGISYGLIDGTVSDAKRTAVVESFQAGLLQTVLLHPQTGAHGLTLTRGRATIWCSPVYQADFLVQGKHRIVRGGQDKKTETILICAEDTVEDLVYERVGDKTTRMSNFLEIIEERRKQ
jgi:SNF2 family DNA or RNA helicase